MCKEYPRLVTQAHFILQRFTLLSAYGAHVPFVYSEPKCVTHYSAVLQQNIYSRMSTQKHWSLQYVAYYYNVSIIFFWYKSHLFILLNFFFLHPAASRTRPCFCDKGTRIRRCLCLFFVFFFVVLLHYASCDAELWCLCIPPSCFVQTRSVSFCLFPSFFQVVIWNCNAFNVICFLFLHFFKCLFYRRWTGVVTQIFSSLVFYESFLSEFIVIQAPYKVTFNYKDNSNSTFITRMEILLFYKFKVQCVA